MTHYQAFILSKIIRWLIIAVALFLIGYGYTMFVLEHAPNENAKRVEQTVKAVCDYANNVNNYSAWQSCFTAENTSNTEYLCKQTCWVEENK